MLRNDSQRLTTTHEGKFGNAGACPACLIQVRALGKLKQRTCQPAPAHIGQPSATGLLERILRHIQCNNFANPAHARTQRHVSYILQKTLDTAAYGDGSRVHPAESVADPNTLSTHPRYNTVPSICRGNPSVKKAA